MKTDWNQWFLPRDMYPDELFGVDGRGSAAKNDQFTEHNVKPANDDFCSHDHG